MQRDLLSSPFSQRRKRVQRKGSKDIQELQLSEEFPEFTLVLEGLTFSTPTVPVNLTGC